jgi:lipopolysaccharide assembly protein A
VRWIYLALVVLFLAVIVIFAWQNFEIITMSFLSFRVRAPLALLAAIIYVLGAATGGSLFALLRRSYQRSR